MHTIAEGFDAESNAEVMRSPRYSKRSCSEVQSQLYIALDEKYLNPTDFEALYELTGKKSSSRPRFYHLSRPVRVNPINRL
jgi:four helix bundle protein